MSELPRKVKIVEVGARDGLQDEPIPVPTAVKIEFINRLSQTGLPAIEATSFVSPKWVPQLSDADDVFATIDKRDGVEYPVLVPNMIGMERAINAGAKEVSVFTAASEEFNQRNISCSIKESIQRFQPVMEAAEKHGIKVRGYISCVLGCPYEGEINPFQVAAVARDLSDLGCYEVSLGDTIGVGTPLKALRMLAATAHEVPMKRLAVHFHDTRGQALANILACVQRGIAVVDASITGLGGCPYADGASGNVATEDVVYMLQGMGIETGIDLYKLLEVGHYISGELGREPTSKLGRIPLAKALDPTKH